MNLLSIGTVRVNRVQNPPLKGDKELIKDGRGSYGMCRCEENNVVVVRWVDNRVVNVASTFVGVGGQPLKSVSRWSKKSKKQLEVQCPRIVTEYNKSMGGVDKFDHLCEIYRMSSRAKRWYIPIVMFMLNLCLVNSWLLYRTDATDAKNLLSEEERKKYNILNSKSFRLQVFHSLTSSVKRGRPSGDEPGALKCIKNPVVPRPCDAVRKDTTDHWPAWSDVKLRCKNCTTGFTFIKCVKCDMGLCFVRDRNCFLQFHC